eukprot:Blabericola_migrator_1__7009@NODE_3552_length_1686_cov_2_355158_g2205_i0_p3_GENE_NODE_3552_length_1686_cov_2_355158_g2205_i0NODE_3552_length_1686_cov_2_355158_g2205_i0_p3_ORF_typecomplete_len104_score12_33_NODE_3552_length_1686_cov_2_355158_g2205_i08911202
MCCASEKNGRAAEHVNYEAIVDSGAETNAIGDGRRPEVVTNIPAFLVIGVDGGPEKLCPRGFIITHLHGGARMKVEGDVVTGNSLRLGLLFLFEHQTVLNVLC